MISHDHHLHSIGQVDTDNGVPARHQNTPLLLPLPTNERASGEPTAVVLPSITNGKLFIGGYESGSWCSASAINTPVHPCADHDRGVATDSSIWDDLSQIGCNFCGGSSGGPWIWN